MDEKSFASRSRWRSWLKRHHLSSPGIWVIFDKKHTGRRTLNYAEALEEAICFGWIDGILRRIDADRYMQKFMPRSARTHWSEANLLRARRLIDAYLMTDAGMEKLGPALERFEKEEIAHRPPRQETFPPHLMALLQKNRLAWENYQRLASSSRRQYAGWVVAAKREETRLRRMGELIAVLAIGEKLGLK